MIRGSSVVIDLLAVDDAAVATLDEIADRQLTVPTLVDTGVGVGVDPATAARFAETMQQVTVVPYDGEAARRAVGIQRQFRQQGDRVGAVDLMIAGIALACGVPAVRRAERHHSGALSDFCSCWLMHYSNIVLVKLYIVLHIRL